ncbi:hypothetical protein FA13DRAFT_1732578 [Coprinellus micaceus]|uniref:Uncharacterized protein n=1 Tax=Coprinellus micaceus TaxID=71717 RepID=A0A4Y7TCL0_COPMI|nr:hypothetical protein FA13DRAFT_1732578 [Coprinellus micaceus]
MSERDDMSYAPLRQHFGTNYAPSRRELVEIESFLPSSRRRLQELSNTIDELKAQQSAWRETIDSLDALCSPTRQLPLDILHEIFYRCLPTNHLPTLDNTEAPLLLARVSRSWRTLVQDMPRLWSRVHIVVPMGSEEHVGFHCNRVERWLACTKSVPLTISLWSENPCPGEMEMFQPFFVPILAHSYHIHTLSIDVADAVLEAFRAPFPTTISANAWPLLHEVVLARALTFIHVYGVNVTTPWSLPVWMAPNLKHISWNSVSGNLLKLKTNWAQLESIDVWWEDHEGYENDLEIIDVQKFCTFSARDVRRLLYHTPLLKQLCIRIAGHDQLSPLGGNQLSTLAMPKTLVLRHLTKLDLWDAANRPQRRTHRTGHRGCLKLMPDLELLWVRDGSENIETSEWGDESVARMEVRPDDADLGKDGKVSASDDSQCTFEGIRRLVEQRNNLFPSSPSRSAAIQRLSFDLQTTDRPTWVPQNAPKLAMDMGIEISLRVRLQNGVIAHQVPKRHQWYDPKEGLPDLMSGRDDEAWP